jgi:hypothetical protein
MEGGGHGLATVRGLMEGAVAGTGAGVAAQRTSIRPVAAVTARVAVAANTTLAAAVTARAAVAITGNPGRNVFSIHAHTCFLGSLVPGNRGTQGALRLETGQPKAFRRYGTRRVARAMKRSRVGSTPHSRASVHSVPSSSYGSAHQIL